MILTENGVLKLMQRIKSFITSQLNTKASSVHTHSISEIENLSSQLGGGYTKSEVDTLLTGKADTSHTHTKSQITDFPSYGTTANTICEGNDSRLSDARTPTSHTHTKSEISDFPSLATVATSGSYNDLSNKPTIPTVNNATLTIQKNGTTIDTFTANSSTDKTVNISVPTNTNQLTNGAGYITADYAVPRSGGAVMRGNALARDDSNGYMYINGGTGRSYGGNILLYGASYSGPEKGSVIFLANNSIQEKMMFLYPNGTWTWSGTACQITSDQRLKQQIAEIDDKLLDAWSDVDLVQFKYNDAVDQKGKDKARLHTGYVVQQIDSACKSHGVDVSAYGLYCHEEYPQETEEVEVEQKDGTKTKETKVIREASEHYSLRYTEVYAVECMYLRREVSRLKQQNENLEQRLKMLEQSVK